MRISGCFGEDAMAYCNGVTPFFPLVIFNEKVKMVQFFTSKWLTRWWRRWYNDFVNLGYFLMWDVCFSWNFAKLVREDFMERNAEKAVRLTSFLTHMVRFRFLTEMRGTLGLWKSRFDFVSLKNHANRLLLCVYRILHPYWTEKYWIAKERTPWKRNYCHSC